MPGEYQLLEHPSDIGILGRGASPDEALVAVSLGLTSIIADPHTFRPLVRRELQVDGSDVDAQVINWLNEILFFFDTEGMVFTDFGINFWTSEKLEGWGMGERLDLDRHVLRTAVKAATFHQFELNATPAGCEIRVFMDV